jgi:hypothetical protein
MSLDKGREMYKQVMGHKTMACLTMAALSPMDERRWTIYREASEAWSEKAVQRKFEELTRRGYIEYGVSERTGWLTDKGQIVLVAEIKAWIHNERPFGISSEDFVQTEGDQGVYSREANQTPPGEED